MASSSCAPRRFIANSSTLQIRSESVEYPNRQHRVRSPTLAKSDFVQIFSRSARVWADGQVKKLFDDNVLLVEYRIGPSWYRKMLQLPGQLDYIRVPKDKAPALRACSLQKHSHAPNLLNDRSLPEACKANPEAYYMQLDSILELLEEGHVVLIKGDWLLRQSKRWMKEAYAKTLLENKELLEELRAENNDKRDLEDEDFCSGAAEGIVQRDWTPLPPRQHLPPEAIVDVDTLPGLPALRDVGIVAISHCWLNTNHPDPNGVLLDEIAAIIWCYLSSKSGWKEIGFSGAFFFAWCSMHQPYHAKSEDGTYYRQDKVQISDEEQQIFRIALSSMHIWYAHSQVEKWLFTMFFDGQGRDYADRGWPAWERAVAGLLGPIGTVLDFRDTFGDRKLIGYDWSHKMGHLKRCCQCLYKIALVPDEFNMFMANKHFTCEGVDRPLVLENYRSVFVHGTSCINNLNLPAMRFEAVEMKNLYAFIKSCTNLQELDLGGNQLGDHGAGELGRVIGNCQQLRELTLDKNGISALHDLVEGLTSCKMLANIDLSQNLIGDDGACDLAHSFMQWAHMHSLNLRVNQIGDRGAAAVVQELRHCSKLSSLDLSRNKIHGKGGCFASLKSCCSLTSLDLASNLFGDDAARNLVHSISRCSELQLFEFYGNELNDAVIEELVATLSNHESLTKHSVGGEVVCIREPETVHNDRWAALFNDEEVQKKMHELMQDEDVRCFATGPEARNDFALGTW